MKKYMTGLCSRIISKQVLRGLFALIGVPASLTYTLYATPLGWTGAAGDNSWHTAANWSGGFVPTSTNDVVISTAGTPTITYSFGAATVRSIQCDEPFVLAGGTLTVTTGATVFNGPVTLTSAGAMTVDGAGASITINGPILRAQSNLTARRGSRINLPTLTTLVMTNDTLSFAGYDAGTVLDFSSLTNFIVDPRAQLQLYAYSGSSIDMHRLANPSGAFYAYATGAGSLIDLSGFSGRLSNSTPMGFKLEAWSGAQMLVPNVTALDGVDIVIRGGQMPTAQITDFARGSIVIYGGTNSFAALTNIIQSDIDLRAGAKLALTNFSRLVVSNANVNFVVHDANTVLDLSNVTNLVADPRYVFAAWAYSGAKIDLRRLVKPTAVLDIYSEGANSVVDLSAFSGHLNPSPAGSVPMRLGAVSSGSVLISNVTSLERVRLEIRNGGRMPTAQLTALIRGTLIAYAITNTFTNLVSVQDTTMDVRTGARVFFPGISSLVASNAGLELSAREAGTLLDLSNVTNIVNTSGQLVSVSGYTGARIDLHRLGRPMEGLLVYADGPGTVIDLSGFAGRLSIPNRMSLEVRNSGSIQIPNVTELDGVDLTIRNNGQIATAQLTSLTRATLSVYTSTNNFSSLRSLQDCDVEVRTGARLSLPGITYLLVTNGSVQLTARDAGTVLDLSSVTNISVGPGAGLYVTALLGAVVDLRNVTRFSEGLVQVMAYDPGSMVNLSGLRYFVCPNQSSALLTLRGGSISFGNGPCIIAKANVDLCAAGQLSSPFAATRDAVVLYAAPWHSYLVEVRPAGMTNAPWQFYQRVPMTSWLLPVGQSPGSDLEFRVQEFIANPSILDMSRTNQDLQLIVYGTPGKTYRVQTTPSIVQTTWQPGPSIAMTNSFRILPWEKSQPILFFRAQEE